MKVQFVFPASTLAIAMILGACSSSPISSSGTGGNSSTGGTTGSGGSSSGTGGGASCPNVTACGGSAVGTWNVTSSCLTVNGSVAASWLGLDPSTCTSVTISGSLRVSGTFTANANGTYTDGTTTTGTPRLDLAPGCLMLSGTKVDCGGIQRTIPGATCTSSSQRRMHVHAGRRPDGRHRRDLERAVEERRLHDRQQRHHAHDRRRRREVRLLRRGQPADLDTPERQSADRWGRSCSRRALATGTGGTTGTGGNSEHRRHDWHWRQLQHRRHDGDRRHQRDGRLRRQGWDGRHGRREGDRRRGNRRHDGHGRHDGHRRIGRRLGPRQRTLRHLRGRRRRPAGRRTARFGRSARRTPARSTRSGPVARA